MDKQVWVDDSHTLVEKDLDDILGADLTVHADVNTDVLAGLEDRHVQQLLCHHGG